MTSSRCLAVTIAALATVVACKKPAPPAPAEVESAPTAPAPVPVASSAAAPEPSESAPVAVAPTPEDDIAVPEDFEDEAAKSINERNYKPELDKLEKEIALTPE